MATAKWTKASIIELLNNSDVAVERAVLCIFARQTLDEQASRSTHWNNSRGFSGAHASRGSYYARWIKSGKRLSGRHLDKARAMMCHYWSQLLEEANSRV